MQGLFKVYFVKVIKKFFYLLLYRCHHLLIQKIKAPTKSAGIAKAVPAPANKPTTPPITPPAFAPKDVADSSSVGFQS